MPRLHLFEFEDFPWFPQLWRNLMTDYLRKMAEILKPYRSLSPLLKKSLEETNTHRLVDLGSGGSGPLLEVLSDLQALGYSCEAILTDKFPNLTAFERTKTLADSRRLSIDFESNTIDATCVPDRLRGFRTMFCSFHHLSPDCAQAVLEDAVRSKTGIAICELTGRSFLHWIGILLVPCFIFIATPFIRPFTFARFFWTYLVPVVPLGCLWDGMVSNFRTYHEPDLRKLLAGVSSGDNYFWQIGRFPIKRFLLGTFLIGVPKLTSTHRQQNECDYS